MFNVLNLRVAPARTALTTVAFAKAQLPSLASQSDAYVSRLIEYCSEQLADYLGVSRSAEGRAILGRATYEELFHEITGENALCLSIAPVSKVISVTEDGVVTSAETGDPPTANPAFDYIIQPNIGTISKASQSGPCPYFSRSVSIIYEAGYVLPGDDPEETSKRTLPFAIEDACMICIQHKLDMVATGSRSAGSDVCGPMQSASIDGVGSFSFESAAGAADRKTGYGVPIEARALLDRYRRIVSF